MQQKINSILPAVGGIIAASLIILSYGSITLVVLSAFELNPIVGVITSAGVAASLFFVGWFYIFLRRQPIRISYGSRSRKLDNYLPLQFLLFFWAFIQLLFWVFDSKNSIHEPRSVLILTVAGVVAYFRVGYLSARGDDS